MADEANPEPTPFLLQTQTLRAYRLDESQRSTELLRTCFRWTRVAIYTYRKHAKGKKTFAGVGCCSRMTALSGRHHIGDGRFVGPLDALQHGLERRTDAHAGGVTKTPSITCPSFPSTGVIPKYSRKPDP